MMVEGDTLTYGVSVSSDEYASPSQQFPEWDLMPEGVLGSDSRRARVWAEVARRHPRRFRRAVRELRWLEDTFTHYDTRT